MTKEDLIMNAGRVLEVDNLDELKEIFTRKVLDVISLLQFKTVVVDFDGTLTEFKYTNETLLPCKDDELEEYSKYSNLYDNVYLLKTMKYILSQINSDAVWVLTVSVPTIRENKNRVIKEVLPETPKSQIIHCNNSDEKIQWLRSIYERTGKPIVFIEDTAKTLLNVEEEFDFVKGLHISSLIP